MRSFLKKSQNAMEFLMTNGFAITIVIVVILLLTFLFGPTDMYLPDKVHISTGITGLDVGADNNTVGFVIQNDIGTTMYNFQANVTQCKDGEGAVSEKVTIASGETKKIGIYCRETAKAGRKFKSDVNVVYYTKGTVDYISQSEYGDLIVTVSEGNMGFAEWVCIEGKLLSISADLNGDGTYETEKGSIVAYTGELTSGDNYNYYSASAHPIVGPVPEGFESHVFLYEGSDGLSFNFYHNVDDGGSTDNIVQWNIETSGNNMADDVILSDDPSELQLNFVDETNEINHYYGDFHYWSNTDGGVIGPFNTETFEIIASNAQSGDIVDANFYSADGTSFALNNLDEELKSFKITFDTYQFCE